MISKAFKTVYFKEVLENIRDKRTMVSSIFMGAFMGPILMVGLVNMMAKMNQEKAEKQLELPAVNIELASNFEKHLKSQNVKLLTIDKTPEEVIKDKDHDVVLVVDPSYPESFTQGQPAKVKLYYDASAKGAARVTVQRVRGLINAYSKSIGAMRLQLRGISPGIMNVVDIENHDQATKKSRGAMVLSILPYFLIVGLFMGSMYLAIDTTAGEKERKSLEPLFLNPTSRSSILSGKLAATISFGIMTLILTLVAFKLTLPFYPFEKMGMTLNVGMGEIFLIMLVLGPLALLAGSLQTIIAAFSKSFREAQTYVNLVIIVPMIPSMLLAFLPIKEKLWMMAIPIMGQNLVINQMVRGEDVGWAAITLVVLGTLLVGFVLAWIAVRLYNKETMLFSD